MQASHAIVSVSPPALLYKGKYDDGGIVYTKRCDCDSF